MYLVECDVFVRFKKKKNIISQILYIIVAPLCSAFLNERRLFLQSSSFWEARCALIGQLSSALWLAEYLKCETEMLRLLPYCDAVSWNDETKTIKPIINGAFVASSGDIITDYNDLYCLFTTNNKHYATLLKTRVWMVSGKFFKYETPDCPCKVGIAPLNRNRLCAQLAL